MPTNIRPIKVCPPELEPREVVPQELSKQNLLGLYQASQYYRSAIGIIAWHCHEYLHPKWGRKWCGHTFVTFFGQLNSIKELPSVDDPCPLYIPQSHGAPASTYRAISWCRTKALHDYLYELVLHDEVMDEQGWIDNQQT